MEEKQSKGNIGTVVRDKEKYFLEMIVGRDKKERLPLGSMLDEAQLKELVGKDVEILYSDPKPSVVGILTKMQRCYFILCYYPPAPWRDTIGTVVPLVDKGVRTQVADKLLNEGVISKEVHGKIVQF